MADLLPSCNDTATRAAILEFADRVTSESSPDYVPPLERIAVFDNDGTLWCEKPMPIELVFVLSGAEAVLETARAEGWTVASVRDDWATVFAEVS